MHAPAAPQIRRLIDLIDYVEATERDKLKVELDYRSHRGFVATEDDLSVLPGVTLDCGSEDDPVWLRVARLAKAPPPEPGSVDASLAPWLSLRDDPEVEPRLKPELPASLLKEVGSLPETDERERVTLDEFEGKEELDLLFELWLKLWKTWAEAEKPRRATIKLYNC